MPAERETLAAAFFKFRQGSGFFRLGLAVAMAQGLHHADGEDDKRDGEQHHIGLDGLELHRAIPPRNAKGGYVPPSVPAGEGDSQQEDHRGDGEGASARRAQREGEHHGTEGGDDTGHAGVDAKVVGPLGGVNMRKNMDSATMMSRRWVGPTAAPTTRRS